MANSTAADYINNRVLRHAVQLRPGYTASPELQQNILDEWQALYDEWDTERNMATNTPRQVFAVTGSGYNANNRDYKIGPNAGASGFVTPLRPEKIVKINLLITTTNPNSRVPINLLSFDDYYDIPVLSVPATGITETCYYEPSAATFPDGVLHFWPPINANSIEIFPFGSLAAPATLAAVVAGTFAPGYENATIYSLAHRCQYLCTKQMGKLNPAIGAWALRARQKVKNINTGNPLVVCDFQNSHPGQGAYDPNLTYAGVP